MQISIVETGLPPEPLRADWPDYPDMFKDLLDMSEAGFAYETLSPVKGEPLPSPDCLEAILITGSAYGVYDKVSWLADLKSFIQDAARAKIPVFGICFGHQIIADAMGGKVIKSPKGWGIGRHTYRIMHNEHWMRQGEDAFSLAVSHQDQIVGAPENTQIIGASEFCPIAGLSYQDAPMASLQGHPEFDPGFAKALYQLRADRIGADPVKAARKSLTAPLSRLHIAHWMANFFLHHKPLKSPD